MMAVIETCWDCGGPCRTYKGSVHGWRCGACLDRYIAAEVVRSDAADDKLRAKTLRKVLERDGGLAAGHVDSTPSRTTHVARGDLPPRSRVTRHRATRSRPSGGWLRAAPQMISTDAGLT
jgi:hypothetical protein